ncbi:MAG: hypothetical protein AB1725_07100 [Armatimonadota bacterium]
MIHARYTCLIRPVGCMSAALLLLLSAHGASLTWLPDSGRFFPTDVSNDGAVIGEFRRSQSAAAIWSPSRGWRLLSPNNSWIQAHGGGSTAIRFSPDGRWICGTDSTPLFESAVVWDRAGGAHPVYPAAARQGSKAVAVSDNGVVACNPGSSRHSDDLPFLAYLQGGQQPLHDFYSLTDISADGSVVVALRGLSGMRWDLRYIVSGPGYEREIPRLQGGLSLPKDLSADGTTVVGYALIPWIGASGGPVVRAFRFRDGVIEDLGSLGEGHSAAHGVSADGRIVVGRSRPRYLWYTHAFRWTPETGMNDLNDIYRDLLSDETEPEFLVHAAAISPNARYICGVGRVGASGRAFLLDTW